MSIAVTQLLLSVNRTFTGLIFILSLTTHVYVGGSLSIRLTVVAVTQVFPIASTKVKSKFPFHVNVYVIDHQLLVMTIPGLENHANVTMTSPLVYVHEVGLYKTIAVGGNLSIHVTVAIILHVFQKISTKSNVNDQLSKNVYSANHELLVIVTHVSENHVKVAITLPFVAVAGV